MSTYEVYIYHPETGKCRIATVDNIQDAVRLKAMFEDSKRLRAGSEVRIKITE